MKIDHRDIIGCIDILATAYSDRLGVIFSKEYLTQGDLDYAKSRLQWLECLATLLGYLRLLQGAEEVNEDYMNEEKKIMDMITRHLKQSITRG
jgi:hypothetical protein